ncbi:hypothetical protein QJQ45_029171 [Haematococcus lacustris]|nr:hypothetical protein QJQ45_029171 [Haematococcus lacustris]
MSLFGWNTVVKNIMERKDVMTWFRRARGVDPPPGSFRASPAWREMQPKLPEVVATSPNTAHFMIGVDWMTMGKNGTWSVGVIMLRLLDVPAEVCGKRACSSVLAVTNGGKHQSHLTGYMKAICQEVSKHIEGPGDLGVIVEPHPGPGVDGVAPARVEPVRIHGVPVVSIADTPATATLTRGMGHSALKMCYNCNISKPPNPPTEKAPLGYDSPTLQTLPGSNREEYVLIYDVRMKFTHEQIMSRGAPFIHGWSQGDPRVVGCHAQPLQHLDARLAHLVPVYHSFMYGLLKHQLDWFMSADGLHIYVRREILKRGAAIQSPSDLGRDLRDLANRTGWRMEDYKHWYVHFSPIVLRGNLLPEPYRGLWTALEGAMLHYLTPGSENSATPAGMAAGYAHLKTYAARLERCRRDPLLPAAHGDNKDKLSVPTDQVCPNLHTTACRLFMQESNVGRTCLFGELWIERDLHDLKSITTSGIPGAQLDAHIAMRVAGHNASKRLLDRAEPEAQQDYKARLKDELTQDGQQALLLGAGSAECPLQNSPGAMMRGCMKAVQDLQKSDEATPWRPWHVKQVFGEALTAREAEEEAKEAPRVAGPAPPYPVRYYQRADCNDTIVFSCVYKRPSTRNNTWVSISFRLDDDKWAIWAGHVQFWVRLEHPKLPGVFLRLAVSRIYLTRPTSHPSCLAATGQAVPRPQQAAGAGAEAEAGGQGGEPPGDGDAAGAAGPSGIGGPQQHRSAKRGVEQAAAGAASTGGARKSQRLADSASQRQADPLPPVEDRLQRSAMGSMHQGYGDEHWYMFDATKIFTVFVTSFEDGEGYGRMVARTLQMVVRTLQMADADPVVWCQDPVGQDPVVWCQDPVGQDPVDPVGVGQDPVGQCQDPVGVQQNPVGVCQDPVGSKTLWVCSKTLWARTLWTLWCQDPVVWCQDPVGVGQDPVGHCQDPVVWCQDPVGQDPVDPVGQDPVVWCQNPVVWCQDPVDPVGQNPVVRCQDPVGVQQDPVVWCQDPVGQDPVVWCQDPVSHNPVVWYQDPVEKDTHYACTPYLLADLPAAGVTVFNISQTTCNRANGWNCQPAPDFLYLLPSSEEGDRSITLDTCVDGVAAWDTVLYVFPAQDGTCGHCLGFIAFNDDNSICGSFLSRVTFTAAAGQAYWVLVEGYSFSVGPCAAAANTPLNVLHCHPVKLLLYPCTPYLLADLPAAGVTVFNISLTTCNRAKGWNCQPAPDFLYLLPSSEEGDRSITLDTCVDGVAAWDTVLYVIPAQDGTCGQCSVGGLAGLRASSWCTGTGVIAFNDEGICDNGFSRVTFIAAAGQAYWVLVEGWAEFSCGVPALTVTTGPSPPPSPPSPPPHPPPDPCTPYLLANLPADGIYNNDFTTCGSANGWNCRPASDFLYLLPSSEEGDRSITLDTFVYTYDFWNTVLYVIPVQDGTCGQCSVRGLAGLSASSWCISTGAIASDDDSSFWDNGLSRLTFTAKAGQAYWILVEGYSASDVDACNPYLLADLPAAGVTVFNLLQSTCNEDNRWNCKAAPDFLYLLPSSEEGDRSITLDTCSEEMATWDSILYVIPTQDGTCGQCSGAIAANDDGSICGGGLSRVTFTAKAGQAYWVLVEGYSFFDTRAVVVKGEAEALERNSSRSKPAAVERLLAEVESCYACGELALTVTTGPVAPPPPLQPTFPPAPPTYPPPPPPDACNPYLLADLPAAGVTVFNISQTTCNRANGWNCRPAPDFLYLLPSSEEGDRSITLDTCVDGVAAWDTVLYVIPAQDGTCGQCSGIIAINDNRSICGNGFSRATFPAAAGQAYWILVEGYSASDVGAAVPALQQLTSPRPTCQTARAALPPCEAAALSAGLLGQAA